MLVRNLINKLEEIDKEIQNTHHPSMVDEVFISINGQGVFLNESNVEVMPSYLPGCGCCCGVDIEINEENDV